MIKAFNNTAQDNQQMRSELETMKQQAASTKKETDLQIAILHEEQNRLIEENRKLKIVDDKDHKLREENKQLIDLSKELRNKLKIYEQFPSVVFKCESDY